MRTLLKTKPFVFLLGLVGLFAVLILVFILWTKLTPDISTPYGFLVFPAGLLGFYFFWIYLIGSGFSALDKERKGHSEIRKFRFVTFLAFIVLLLEYLLNFYFLTHQSNQITEFVNILLGLVSLYCFLYIAVKLTINFRFYDNKEKPGILNYVVTMFLLSFFPFGLLIMHSHLRLLLKENKLVE